MSGFILLEDGTRLLLEDGQGLLLESAVVVPPYISNFTGQLPATASVTVTKFNPTPQAPFQFQAVLDGQTYNVIVTWNTGGQRWFVNVIDQSNVPVVTVSMIGSPNGFDISLVAGYFVSTLVFRSSTQSFEVRP